MCISDYRIGRLITTNVQQWDNNAGTGLTLSANRQRVGLLVTTAIIMTGTQGYLITFGGGTRMTQYGVMNPPLLLIGQVGQLVQQSVTISLLVGNIQGSYTEFILPENVLADEIQRFESELARLNRPGY